MLTYIKKCTLQQTMHYYAPRGVNESLFEKKKGIIKLRKEPDSALGRWLITTQTWNRAPLFFDQR